MELSCHGHAPKLGVFFLSVNLPSGLWSGSVLALEYPQANLSQNEALVKSEGGASISYTQRLN